MLKTILVTGAAKRLGRADCAELLQQNLQEEEETDRKLTMLADSILNPRAASV